MKEFDYTQKQLDRDNNWRNHYYGRYWSEHIKTDFRKYGVYLQVQNIREELKTCTYHKRIKKLTKRMNAIMDEYPEQFI